MNGTALHKPTARRVVGMVAGIVIIALGIALFKQDVYKRQVPSSPTTILNFFSIAHS